MSGARSSIVGQLNRGVLAAVVTIWMVVSALGAWYAQVEVNEGLDNMLVDTSLRLLHLARHDLDLISAAGQRVRPPTQPGEAALEHDYLMYQVLDAKGRLLLRSDDAPETALELPLRNGFSEIPGWRVYTHIDPALSLVIHAGDSLEHRREAMIETMTMLMLPAMLALPLTALVIRRILRRGLSPLAALAGELEKRHGDDFRPIEASAIEPELKPIVESTNLLLARLGSALRIERTVSANIAHELRTPLSAVRWRLHALLDVELPAHARDAVERAQASLDLLVGRTEKLLQLSRAESGASLTREAVDLSALAGTVLEEFWGRSSLLDRLRLHTPADTDVHARGDFDALGIALRNLVENAIRHGGDGPIDVYVEPPATIRVRDSGPGVSERELDVIRERHVSGGLPTVGFGLGLSIVELVVDRQGGSIAFASPPPGRASGLEVTLALRPSGVSPGDDFHE